MSKKFIHFMFVMNEKFVHYRQKQNNLTQFPMKKDIFLAKIEPLFYCKNYSQVSLNEIADFLWIKKPSLYNYYTSKEEMYLALLDFSFNNFMAYLKELLQKFNKKNFSKLMDEFWNYWKKSKNLFFSVNTSQITEKNILENIQEKQKIILETFTKMSWYSKERVYLFLIIAWELFKKDSNFSKCEINHKIIVKEMENLFLN